MGHRLDAYFTEIEDECNRAQNKIDLNFEEIQRKIIEKQKALKQEINEWKLNKLEVINAEICDINKWKKESKANESYKGYDKEADFIKYIESITPLIDICFNQNMNQSIDKLAELKQKKKTKMSRMSLSYHLHRNHALHRHQKSLLFHSDTKQYWSSFNCDFEQNENDWIVFQRIVGNKIPKKILFKNYKSAQDVKRMNVFIGNLTNNEWHSLTQCSIKPISSKKMQCFEVDNFDNQWSKYQFIKLQFVENFGENNSEMCRFCCRYFGIMEE